MLVEGFATTVLLPSPYLLPEGSATSPPPHLPAEGSATPPSPVMTFDFAVCCELADVLSFPLADFFLLSLCFLLSSCFLFSFFILLRFLCFEGAGLRSLSEELEVSDSELLSDSPLRLFFDGLDLFLCLDWWLWSAVDLERWESTLLSGDAYLCFFDGFDLECFLECFLECLELFSFCLDDDSFLDLPVTSSSSDLCVRLSFPSIQRCRGVETDPGHHSPDHSSRSHGYPDMGGAERMAHGHAP